MMASSQILMHRSGATATTEWHLVHKMGNVVKLFHINLRIPLSSLNIILNLT